MMDSQSAIAELDAPEPLAMPKLPRFSVLGVRIDNIPRRAAFELLEQAIQRRDVQNIAVYFVNAHTLNLAAADRDFHETLNTGDFVFADGTGIRWAARLQGARVAENMVGTDFVPEMFQTTAGRGYTYFMLGADEATIPVAADYARRSFPGWELVGYRHGFLTDQKLTDEAIERINSLRPDVLLVGMGNPIQEKWIRENLSRLDVPVLMGIGGLFDYWAGNVSRAPAWIRRIGHEWLWRLYQQPILKARRYLIGNPLFLARVLREKLAG